MAESLLAIDQPIRLRTIEQFILSTFGRVRNLTPAEALVLRRWVAQIVGYIKARWPVDTGTSRDRWTYTLALGEPGAIGFRVQNPMWYARWVHYAGQPSEPRLWTVLVPEAVFAFRDGMMADLQAAILRTEAVRTGRLAELAAEGSPVVAETFAAPRNSLLDLVQLRPLTSANLSPVGGA